ncbi:uncharacterized protein LOC106080223 isoform X3 [Biomphalaria glabrata]|uniref:Uncharacterized protein LOC106080223 isoform X3 n=1 Tax=Biomphalaria glabrata TaxID=6526 RepID=A0A9W3AWB4_BIOGL|nr:uncharacterized protein LOC106080223 isoform X3 [Biomphalaria glabrata]
MDHHHDNISASKDESKSGTQEMDDRANDVSQGSAKDYHDHTSIKKQKLDSESEQEMENDSSSRIVSDVDRKKCIRLKDYRAQGKKPFNAISESKSGTQEMDDRANDVSQGSAKDYHDHTSIKKQKLDSESEQEMENDSSSRIVSDVDRKKCIRLKDYRAQGKKPFNAISESKSGTQEMDDRANDVSPGNQVDGPNNEEVTESTGQKSLETSALDPGIKSDVSQSDPSTGPRDVYREQISPKRAQGKKPFNAISDSLAHQGEQIPPTDQAVSFHQALAIIKKNRNGKVV